MNAKQMQAEIEETLLRNFKILQESARWEIISSDDFADMLRASAANLAQVYADRVYAPAQSKHLRTATERT